MEQERINGYTLDELREINNVGSASEQDLQNLGMLEAPQQEQQKQPEHTNKILNTADKLGLETPAADKEYQKLSVGDSLKDATVSLGVEASHIFVSKANELNYESKTKLGETMKYGYRYLAGTASLFLGGGLVGGAIKGVGAINKASKIEKIGSGIQKLFTGADIIKTGESASKAAQVGAKIVNASLGGAFSGAIADYTLYRPEDGEGHMADAFGDTDNTFIKWLQSNPNDTETDAKFKNLVEGFVMGLGTGNIIEFGIKPIFGRLLKNIKIAVKANTPEVAEAALKEVALDEIKLDKFSNKADMYNSVKGIVAEADVSGDDASQLVIDRMNVNDVPEAQKMLKVLQDGEDVFLHQDGTWDIKVNNWEDAQKVSKEEYIKQLKAKDVNNAKDMFNDKEVFSGDSAISDMDAATKHTWTNRGWIGENEELTPKAGNKIAKNYKDKWQINNNIKVEFVDGLMINGKAMEGNTSSTNYLGKTSKNKQNAVDKKQLQIQKIEDKLAMAEGGNGEVADPLDVLKEELRIAKNELKDLKASSKGKDRISDITIQIDKNAQNPYATLRSELEHARDIAKGEVPNQAEKHFSRYEGMHEAEAAPDYVYKKSVGRAKKAGYEATVADLNNNVKQYESDGYSFKDTPPSTGAGEKRYELKNDKDETLGYVEYTIKDDTLEIGEIRNQTKRIKNFKNGEPIPKKEGEIPTTPDVAKKLIDKVISENPNLKIKWDAVTNDGIEFKEKYLEQHPELTQNMSGISNREELDTLMKNEYDTTKGVSNEAGDISEHGSSNAGTIRETNTSNDRIEPTSNSTGKSISKQNGDLVQSNTQADTRGKVTNTDISPEQIDLDTKIEAKQTVAEIVDGIVNGELKIESTADVESIIQGVLKTDPTIKDNTFKSLAKAADALADSMFADDKDLIKNIKQAIADNNPEQAKAKVIRALALLKVVPELIEKINNPNLKPSEHLAALETLGLIKASNKETASAAGGVLGAMNLLKNVTNVFSNASLTSLSREGITNLVDVLDKEIKRIVSLNFTYEQGQKELFNTLVNNQNVAFKELLMSDSKLAIDLKKVFDGALKAGKKLDKTKLEEMITKTIVSPDIQKVMDNIRRCPDKKSGWKVATNGIRNYYLTNLLSGVGSTLKNAFSGALNTLIFPAEKVLAGAICGGGKELMNEGLYTYKGMVKSMAESYNLMNQAFIKGEGSLARIGDTLEGFENDNWMKPFQEGNGKMTRALNAFTIMSRCMMATDEFIKQLNYRSIARGKSYAQAIEIQAHDMLGDKTVDDLAEEILTSKFYNADGGVSDKDVLYEANQATYQTNLSGKMINPKTGENEQMREQTVVMNSMNHLNEAANKFLPLKIMFPFLRTGTNILQSNLDHNFAYEAGADLLRFMNKEQELKLFGKGREAAMTRSRCAFGFIGLGTGVGLASAGLITGSPPTDREERKALFDTGWRPYSWNVGGRWVSYQGYEPIQTWLGFAADSYRIYTETADAEKDAKVQTFMLQAGAAITNNFIDKAAFRTGVNQLNWLFNPEGLRKDDIFKIGAQMASGLILPWSSGVKGWLSVGNREVTQPTEYERIYNMYGNRGVGDYRRDVFGNRQDIFGVLLTTSSNNNYDMPEYQELARLGMSGFQAPKIGDIIANDTIKVKEFKHPQTKKSVYDYMQDKLSSITIGGKTLQEAVRELVQDPYYKVLIDGTENTQAEGSAKKIDYAEIGDTKASMLKDLFIEYNNYAKEEALFDCGNYTNDKGQNIEEVQQQIMLNTKSKIINQNLNKTVDKINNLF